MSASYTRVYVHIVFSVKNRARALHKEWRNEVFAYMAGIIKNKGHIVLGINGVEDHVHILTAIRPHSSLSDLVRDIKNNSTNFINERNWVSVKFAWQSGFGAFSCDHRNIERVVAYIQNQEEHHKSSSFTEELRILLNEAGISFQEKYLFEIQ
ncbi:MAG: IS200/IS605 family transposase [Flavobacteriales bacterium]|nr:IS200/IS605 family transposase [Flavobacteriales bacterium]